VAGAFWELATLKTTFLRRLRGFTFAALVGFPGAALLAQPAATPASPPPAVAAAVPQSTLPHDLSPQGLYLQADRVVKSVIIVLVLASLATWTVWIAKTLELRQGRRRVRASIAQLGTARSLHAVSHLPDPDSAAMFGVAVAEVEAINGKHRMQPDSIKERVAARVQRLEAAAGRRLTRGASLLATVGSIGPFVGLFGTVWGIMNSFIGISQSQTTNLAVVAPGIAEALLATAAGLVAAIPAVLVYNMVARGVSGYRLLLAESSTLVMCVLSHDLDARAEPNTLARVA
jgi:biopolymer transport protein ExbB